MFKSRPQHGTRGPATLAVATVLACVPTVLESSQTPQLRSVPTWESTVDLVIAGKYPDTTAALDVLFASRSRQPLAESVVRFAGIASDKAIANEERVVAYRRLKGAALLCLEALLPPSAFVAEDPRFSELEGALAQSIQALHSAHEPDGISESSVSLFRSWAEIGLAHYVLNSGRLQEAQARLGALKLPKNAPSSMYAEFYLLQGIAQERIARLVTVSVFTGPTMNRYGSQSGGGPAPAMASTTRQAQAKSAFMRAGRWYDRVLEVEPDDQEARLHRGRIWLDLDRPVTALEVLSPLTRASCVSTSCSLAFLFSGAAHEALGARSEASAAYLRASGDAASRQPALIALMRLAVFRGDRAAGLSLAHQLRDAAPLARGAGPDAWAVYVGGRRPVTQAVLAPLRSAVRE